MNVRAVVHGDPLGVCKFWLSGLFASEKSTQPRRRLPHGLAHRKHLYRLLMGSYMVACHCHQWSHSFHSNSCLSHRALRLECSPFFCVPSPGSKVPSRRKRSPLAWPWDTWSISPLCTPILLPPPSAWPHCVPGKHQDALWPFPWVVVSRREHLPLSRGPRGCLGVCTWAQWVVTVVLGALPSEERKKR